MNKKGAELAIGTIVIIVLALVVLVVLVVGFTGGWSNLWGRISSFFGGANVDSTVQACNIACTTQSTYDYCQRTRKLEFDVGEELETVTITCQMLEEGGTANNKDGDVVDLPLVELSCDLECPARTVEDKKTCSDLSGAWVASGNPCPGGDLTSQVTDPTGKGDATEKCCKI
jgi:hypothetical protein